MIVLVDGIHMTSQMKGVGRYLLNSLQKIVQLDPGMEFHVLILDSGESQKFVKIDRIKWIQVPYHNHLRHGFWTVPMWVRRIRPDLIWFPYETAFRMKSYPYAMVCHDVPRRIREAQKEGAAGSPVAVERAYHRIDDLLLGWTLRRAGRIFCNSNYVADWLKQEVRVDASRIVLAPCAPGADFFQLSQEVDVQVVRQRLHSPEGYILVFFTGDLRENLTVVPRVYQNLIENGSPSTLVIAGVRDEARGFVEYSLSGVPWCDRVRIVPFLESGRDKELAELYTAASVYLDPSLHEGFGMQVIEAMACGTPVVCSNRGALPEVAGDAALLVNPLGIDEIVRALTNVFNAQGLRERMIERGYKRSASFSWETTAKVIYEGLTQVAGR